MNYTAQMQNDASSSCITYRYTHEHKGSTYVVSFTIRTVSCCGVREAGCYDTTASGIPKELWKPFCLAIMESLQDYCGAVLFTFVQYRNADDDWDDDDWQSMSNEDLFNILGTASSAVPGATCTVMPEFENPNTGNLITPVMLTMKDV